MVLSKCKVVTQKRVHNASLSCRFRAHNISIFGSWLWSFVCARSNRSSPQVSKPSRPRIAYLILLHSKRRIKNLAIDIAAAEPQIRTIQDEILHLERNQTQNVGTSTPTDTSNVDTSSRLRHPRDVGENGTAIHKTVSHFLSGR